MHVASRWFQFAAKVHQGQERREQGGRVFHCFFGGKCRDCFFFICTENISNILFCSSTRAGKKSERTTSSRLPYNAWARKRTAK